MFTPTANLKRIVVLAFILPVALGDFMIYVGAQTDLTPGSGSVAGDTAWVISGEPACGGGWPTNSGPTLANDFDDVHFLQSGFNCDGCGGSPIGDYDIKRFELWDEDDPKEWGMYGSTTGHVGYLTMYQQADKTYQLVSTKKIGGAFTFWGTCYRAPKNSDDFFCTAIIANTYGKHVLTCVTPLQLQGLGPVPAPPGQPSTAPSIPPAPRVKIMVAGDSISHGMENDWTWRWRLFAWIEAQGHGSLFVGPYGGTAGPSSPAIARPQPPAFPGEQSPAAPAAAIGLYAPGVAETFLSSGHASWWGRQAAQTKDTIQEWVRNDQPRFLLLMLGFNDLGWGVSDAAGLLKTMKQLVDEARKGKSNVQILIGNVIHRTFLREDLITNTNKYNADLRAAIPSWSTSESPISYVDVQGNYDCNRDACPDGYDGLHPNSRGEYHIAQAFARVLKANHGFTGTDFVVPANPEPRSLTVPNNPSAGSIPEGIYVGWRREGNSRGYDIRSRLRGQTSWSSEGPVYPNTNALYMTAVTEGQSWEFQVRSSGDNNEKSAWSGVFGAVAHPETAPAPINVVATPRANGIQVTWNAVAGYDINRYAVVLWDMDVVGYPGVYGAPVTNFVMDGLIVGHRYLVSVSTWINLKSGPAGGPTSGWTEAIVGGSLKPVPPKNVEVFEYNALEIQLGWPAAPGAQGYHVYRRPIVQNNDAIFTRIVTTTFMTTVKVDSLFPGVWNYEFCIASYFGALESDHSTACVKPPIYPGWAPGAPTHLEVFEYDATTIQLGWHSSNGAEGYHVWRRPITQNNDAEFTNVGTLSWTTWKVENLFPGVWHYEFCISAYAGGMESDHSTACIKPPVTAGWAPLSPSNLEVFEYDATTIQLGWHSSNGAEGYHVYRRPITQDNDAAFTMVGTLSWTTWKVENLFPGVWHYEFCISAYAADKESDHSTACIKPPLYPGWAPSPPTHLEVFEYDATTIQLGWYSSNGAEGYNVYSRNIPNNGALTKISTVPKYTTVGIGFLFPGVWNFQFCVSAYGGGLESDHTSACVIPRVVNKKRELALEATNSTSPLPPFSGHIVIYPNGPYTLEHQYNVTLNPGNSTLALKGNNTTLLLIPATVKSTLAANTASALLSNVSMVTLTRPKTTALSTVSLLASAATALSSPTLS